jgi:DNA polymerase I-like protein with 3'-5' exonuclease and polymerase domains
VPRIPTADLKPDSPLSAAQKHSIYNALDCCLTQEIFGVLDKQLHQTNDPVAARIYAFERGMQAPALDMMLRGFRIDQYQRRVAISDLQQRRFKIERILDQFARAVWGKGLNPGSPKQMKDFFYYDKAGLCLPEQHKIERGVRKVSTDRECLEKLKAYFYAVPIINAVLAIRDTIKKLGVLTSEVDRDGRLRTSYNVAGTETGRWSSSANAFGSGTNLQNITPELRRMFISDKGKKLCYLDLEQAESFVVGLLVWMCTGDGSYLDACESGDLHTSTARLVWPNLGWLDDKGLNKKIAEQVFYRGFSYRDMAKRGGHGTNYYGTPRTMAKHLKVLVDLMVDFQGRYFRAYPGLGGPDGYGPRRLTWHKYVAQELGIHQVLTTPLGRQRHFFGRPGDDATLREAIAYVPQSVVGDLLNYVLWCFWHQFQEVQLLAQIHDAIIFQFDEGTEDRILPRALSMAKVPITVESLVEPGKYRTITIGSECKIGWNWADAEIKTSLGKKIKNPDGLIKWKPGQVDSRRRLEGLARIVS